ncbi:hypothetical protein [Bradyrhizobium sp. CCBAU 51765]|uniref:hypothetical protein n=1 Tax=Bradyrhizobium sp. CCBAU 51765 TaxID=1325102 RepID=UPI0018895D2C|nr:hypothetical protein [Bradyrhizobium sp. CCBAU 51765]
MTRERHAWFMACNCGLNCGMQQFPPIRLRGAHGAMRAEQAAWCTQPVASFQLVMIVLLQSVMTASVG